ncbi:MAG: Quinoprotein glucose dehydrogenase [Candidatus Woesebacteria bacterium GW2011_GWB1_40_101]|uniref:Quinoprotein glucose dehydrogenase n=3 Tax=Candidatus Woeseibacteriota TaxID=1752722 RepID=A0A0G0QG52_9BACT|nr:MAG: Quinoprotein glucose dehydrogenase [Candidatus Woesebacteria bacterium GW2011_GWB1_40_101]
MMKNIVILLGILILAGVGVWYLNSRNINLSSFPNIPLPLSQNVPSPKDAKDAPATEVIAQGLDTPWSIAFLPDGNMLVTERKGTVRLNENPIATIKNSKEIGEGGLLGIALDPNFSANYYVYLYYTYSESGGNTLNRVVRMKYKNNQLIDEKIIVEAIPGASNHNGGRVKFGPDGFLYITTGDAQNPSSAQDTNSLAGKILRVDENGNPAGGNPFGNRVYSFGHRNPQGITWDKNGALFETEHGPSGTETGNDEFNKIEIGKNYGWPDIRGKETKEGMVTPIAESGRTDTWAPAGLAYLNGKFYFTGLRGEALYEVTLNGASANLKTHFKGEFGRLRDVIVGPDGMLYLTTSNRDGRGVPKAGDDKIIRINPDKL